ncbi:MAG: RluA family pseudouridine synthase [Pseudomonadales bacterium]|jgi:23S rRNA-/tRNA-specific pseudouridylate synthase|nr:RluA family pseudouridine synthase [Pseudomonadales bacterium]
MSERDAALPARILWQDAQLLVLDKPAGVSVLADRSGAPSLLDALRDWGEGTGLRPRLVHRIDKGTSGLLLVALSAEAERTLGRAFETRAIGKWYTAVSAAPLPWRGSHELDLPLAKGRKNRQRVAGPREAIRERRRGPYRHYFLPKPVRSRDKPGQDALTRVRALCDDGERAWLCVHPITGRTHQIRVHLAWIGCPLLGDALYGRPEDPHQRAPRLALHCHRLQLPALGDGVMRPSSFRAPMPEDLQALLPTPRDAR